MENIGSCTSNSLAFITKPKVVATLAVIVGAVAIGVIGSILSPFALGNQTALSLFTAAILYETAAITALAMTFLCRPNTLPENEEEGMTHIERQINLLQAQLQNYQPDAPPKNNSLLEEIKATLWPEDVPVNEAAEYTFEPLSQLKTGRDLSKLDAGDNFIPHIYFMNIQALKNGLNEILGLEATNPDEKHQIAQYYVNEIDRLNQAYEAGKKRLENRHMKEQWVSDPAKNQLAAENEALKAPFIDRLSEVVHPSQIRPILNALGMRNPQIEAGANAWVVELNSQPDDDLRVPTNWQSWPEWLQRK